MGWKDDAIIVPDSAALPKKAPPITSTPSASDTAAAGFGGFTRSALSMVGLDPGDVEGAIAAATHPHMPHLSDLELPNPLTMATDPSSLLTFYKSGVRALNPDAFDTAAAKAVGEQKSLEALNPTAATVGFVAPQAAAGLDFLATEGPGIVKGAAQKIGALKDAVAGSGLARDALRVVSPRMGHALDLVDKLRGAPEGIADGLIDETPFGGDAKPSSPASPQLSFAGPSSPQLEVTRATTAPLAEDAPRPVLGPTDPGYDPSAFPQQGMAAPGKGWSIDAEMLRQGLNVPANAIPESEGLAARARNTDATLARGINTDTTGGGPGLNEAARIVRQEIGTNPARGRVRNVDVKPEPRQAGGTGALGDSAPARGLSVTSPASPEHEALLEQEPSFDKLAQDFPMFDEMGNEIGNPNVREAWRQAGQRFAAPIEGGPTEGTSSEDAAAMLGRGGPTKGGLLGSSQYFPKRNALLRQQASGAGPVAGTAADLLASSRTATPEEALAKQIEGDDDVHFLTDIGKARANRPGYTAEIDARRAQQAIADTDKAARVDQRADALPKSPDATLRTLLDANGITDHDSAAADQAYRVWKAGGRKGPKPASNLGGMLDSFDAVKDKPGSASSLLEAWEKQTKGAKTWRDLDTARQMLAEALGVDEIRLPDDVVQRHVSQDANRR